MRSLPILLLVLCPCLFYTSRCAAQDISLSDSAIIGLDMSATNPFFASGKAALQDLLQNKRVVMLGEATHGEGNVQEIKTRMVEWLHEAGGFTVLAFESGIYDLYKANKEWQAGQPFREVIARSIFPIWVNSRQCQPLWQYLDQHRSAITLAGFDSQLSGEYGRNMVADLEDYWEQQQLGAAPDFDGLENAVQYMADHLSFPATPSFNAFEKEIHKALQALNRATGPDRAFWQQALRSVLALARDYHTHNPTARNEQTFKAADSNPRDHQMALNLLFLLKQYPNARIICWGATTHFMNDPTALQNEELKSYTPMGKLLKEALGDQVYIIGVTAGSGSYGIFEKNITPVQVASHSLEATLSAGNRPASFIALRQLPDAVFTTQAIEHKPLTGKWQNVLDGMIYLPQITPSAFYTPPISADQPSIAQQPASDVVNQQQPGKMIVGKITGKGRSGPVPFASVSLRGKQPATLVSNNAGLFEWPAGRLVDSIEISCIGYQTLQQQAPAVSSSGTDTLYFRLTENPGVLQAVIVTAPEKDPGVILKKVIDKRKANLAQKDFTVSMYVHEVLREKKDTLRDVEYISNIYSQKGYSEDFSVRSGLSALKWNKKQPDSTFRKTGSVLNMANTALLKSFSRIDYLYDLPLFSDKNKIKSYRLSLDSMTTLHDELVYVIRFESKRTSERYTFAFNTARFYGVVYVNSRNYAILQYNITVESDTTRYNGNARRFFNKPVFENDRYFWSLLKTSDVVNKNVIYTQREGVYIPVYASLTHRQQGTAQLSQTPVSYTGSAEFFLYDFAWGTAGLSATPETSLYKFSKPYDPVFWNALVKPFSNVY